MSQGQAFQASVVASLRSLADTIESGTQTARELRHGADYLTVCYAPAEDAPTPRARADPRPCECSSKPVDAGDGEHFCPECEVTWTP